MTPTFTVIWWFTSLFDFTTIERSRFTLPAGHVRFKLRIAEMENERLKTVQNNSYA